MALTKPIQDVCEGNPIATSYKPVKAEYTLLLTELQDGSLPVYKAASILASGAGGIGYASGAGGAVTQITSKSTGVTLNKACGVVTMSAVALAAGATVEFLLTNSEVTINDVIAVTIQSPDSKYRSVVVGTQVGACIIEVTNKTAGSLSEAVKVNFAVLNVVTT